MIDVGEPAPSFRARTTSGDEVALEDFRGRYLVLYFYPRAFTPGCTREAQRFRDNYPELRELGAEVLGVSVDDHSTQCAFAERLAVTFPLVGDDDHRISQAYGVRRGLLPFDKRVTFVVDPSGQVVARFHHEFQIHRHLDDVLRFLKQQPRADAHAPRVA